MGAWLWSAAALAVIGVLALLLLLQSPSLVLWNGIEVHGYTQNGLTYYHYKGELYATDNIHASAADSRKRPTTVWLSRKDPTDTNRAYVENPYTRWTDFAIVMGWFIAAFLVLVIGFTRRAVRRRRRAEVMGQFGGGISDHLVRELLSKRQEIRRVPFNPDE